MAEKQRIAVLTALAEQEVAEQAKVVLYARAFDICQHVAVVGDEFCRIDGG
ncbi:hypothetical protein D3C78_1888870 [compost metagenome]